MRNKKLCLELLQKWGLPYSRQLSIAAMTLSLFCEDDSVSKLLADRAHKGAWSPDASLVAGMFRGCGIDGRVSLITNEFGFLIAPDLFGRLFRQTFRAAKKRPEYRRRLAVTLRDFLLQHPPLAPQYSSTIRQMMSSAQADVDDVVIEMVGLLGMVKEADFALISKMLRSRSAKLRLSAVKSLYFCLGWRKSHSPGFRARWRKWNFEGLLKEMAKSEASSEVRQLLAQMLKECAGEMKKFSAGETE